LAILLSSDIPERALAELTGRALSVDIVLDT